MQWEAELFVRGGGGPSKQMKVRKVPVVRKLVMTGLLEFSRSSLGSSEAFPDQMEYVIPLDCPMFSSLLGVSRIHQQVGILYRRLNPFNSLLLM